MRDLLDTTIQLVMKVVLHSKWNLLQIFNTVISDDNYALGFVDCYLSASSGEILKKNIRRILHSEHLTVAYRPNVYNKFPIEHIGFVLHLAVKVQVSTRLSVGREVLFWLYRVAFFFGFMCAYVTKDLAKCAYQSILKFGKSKKSSLVLQDDDNLF